MATHAEETWLNSSYYVRPLHPTLEYLMWDYGSLDCYQERDYIRTKMQMLHKELSNIEVCVCLGENKGCWQGTCLSLQKTRQSSLDMPSQHAHVFETLSCNLLTTQTLYM